MYEYSRYLKLEIDKFKQFELSNSFHYNDLAILIAFGQSCTKLSSEDIPNLRKSLKEDSWMDKSYEFLKNPSIQQLTNYLISQKVLIGSEKEVLEQVSKGVNFISPYYGGLIESLAEPEDFLNPGYNPLTIGHSFYNYSDIYQLVLNHMRYKTPDINKGIFFGFTKD